jgi:hypothetical protein
LHSIALITKWLLHAVRPYRAKVSNLLHKRTRFTSFDSYERRSILITANQPFSGWDNVFPDPGMTVAAIDRLVHHSTIFELNNVESYRGKQAARQQKNQRDSAKRQRQSSKDNDKHPPEPKP